MTNYKNSLMYGSGLLETMMNAFTSEKYLLLMLMLGPGTRLDIRLDENLNPKPGEEPINDLDRTALKHDIAYQKNTKISTKLIIKNKKPLL